MSNSELLALVCSGAAGLASTLVALRGLGWLSRRHRCVSAIDNWLAPGVTVRAPLTIQICAMVGRSALAFRPVELAFDCLPFNSRVASMEHMLQRVELERYVDARALHVGRCVAAALLAVVGLNAFGVGGALDVVMALAGGLTGFSMPTLALSRMVRARQTRLQLALAPALDILAIGIGASGTFDQAIDLYCARFNGPLADELRLTRREMSLGRSRHAALTAFAERSDLDSVRAFVAAVLQGERFGTPIAHTLRAQAQQAKIQRRQWVQEQLAKAPIKMLMPLGGFVVPSLLIVLLGPTVLQILQRGLF